jgi:hypothetical protein
MVVGVLRGVERKSARVEEPKYALGRVRVEGSPGVAVVGILDTSVVLLGLERMLVRVLARHVGFLLVGRFVLVVVVGLLEVVAARSIDVRIVVELVLELEPQLVSAMAMAGLGNLERVGSIGEHPVVARWGWAQVQLELDSIGAHPLVVQLGLAQVQLELDSIGVHHVVAGLGLLLGRMELGSIVEHHVVVGLGSLLGRLELGSIVGHPLVAQLGRARVEADNTVEGHHVEAKLGLAQGQLELDSIGVRPLVAESGLELVLVVDIRRIAVPLVGSLVSLGLVREGGLGRVLGVVLELELVQGVGLELVRGVGLGLVPGEERAVVVDSRSSHYRLDGNRLGIWTA